MKRRRFLQTCAGAGLLAPWALSAPRLFAGDEEILPLDSLPLLMVDDGGIARNSGAVRSFYPAQTLPAPVIKADRPWESGRVYHYGSVFRDETSGEYRLWYGTPKPSKVLYATSPDGLAWEKPALGLVEFEGGRDNNILIEDLHSASIIIDAREADPARRYKLVGAQRDAYLAFCSPDGLHWTREPAPIALPVEDTLNLTQDPASGDYLLYHKRQVMLRGFKRRTVWLSRSADFRRWSKPVPVFEADLTDDAWAGAGQRTDVYNMAVFPHAAGYFGLPTMFQVRATREKSALGEGQSPDDGPIHVELATSRDGVAWKRPEPRISLLPAAEGGAFDRGAILGLSNQFVHHEGKSVLYYTGLTTTHGAPIPPKELSIGRAAWRLHGLASLDAGAETVRLETKLLRCGRCQLSVNADATGGSLRVGLLEADGREIPGCTLGDCQPLVNSETAWIAQMGIPVDRPVRVVVEMSRAKLFSISAA